MNPSVIIVGSGRSGTSTLAKLCHEHLGICMGHALKKGDQINPEGYYEDLVSHAIVRAMANGQDPGPYNPEVYLSIMNLQHQGCLSWGVKDPWFLYLPLEHLRALAPRLCIVALRDVDATVKSWYKMFQARHPGAQITNKVTEHYKNLTESRQEMCKHIKDEVWPNTIYLDFTERIPDEDLLTAIRDGLAASSYRRNKQ